jgi:hypothetical protein
MILLRRTLGLLLAIRTVAFRQSHPLSDFLAPTLTNRAPEFPECPLRSEDELCLLSVTCSHYTTRTKARVSTLLQLIILPIDPAATHHSACFFTSRATRNFGFLFENIDSFMQADSKTAMQKESRSASSHLPLLFGTIVRGLSFSGIQFSCSRVF